MTQQRDAMAKLGLSVLLGILLSLLFWGGFLSLGCTNSAVIPSGRLAEGQEGVTSNIDGLLFDPGSNSESALYDLHPGVELGAGRGFAPCEWKPVKNFDGLSTATSLDDLPLADSNDVEADPQDPSRFRIKRDDSQRIRTVKWVCKYTDAQGETQFRRHQVRVANGL